MKKCILLIMILILSIPTMSFSSVFLSDDNSIISSDEEINDDVYMFANNLELYGSIMGDFTGFVYQSTVDGYIEGSVNLLSKDLEIEGEIGHSARLFAQNIDISGKIGKDVLAFGQHVTADRKAIIGRDLTIGGAIIYVDCEVTGEARFYGESVIISGHIGGDLIIKAEEIVIDNRAVIEGDFFYESRNEAQIETGATINGEIDREIPKIDSSDEGALGIFAALSRLGFFFMSLVTGLVLIGLFRNHAKQSARFIQEKFPLSVGYGFLSILVFFAGAFLLFIMIVGIPLSIMLFMLGLVFIYIGKIYFSIATGKFILNLIGKKETGEGWAFVLGLIIITILFTIPVIGKITYFVAFIVGTGGAIGGYLSLCRKMNRTETTEPINTEN